MISTAWKKGCAGIGRTILIRPPFSIICSGYLVVKKGLTAIALRATCFTAAVTLSKSVGVSVESISRTSRVPDSSSTQPSKSQTCGETHQQQKKRSRFWHGPTIAIQFKNPRTISNAVDFHPKELRLSLVKSIGNFDFWEAVVRCKWRRHAVDETRCEDSCWVVAGVQSKCCSRFYYRFHRNLRP